MEILFSYVDLAILQNEYGEVFVVSLFDTGKVVQLNQSFNIDNDYVESKINEVMHNQLGSNEDIQEYINAYRLSDCYDSLKRWNED